MVELPLTTPQSAEWIGDRRSKRSHFTDEQKTCNRHGDGSAWRHVAAVARRHDVVTDIIFRWRVPFRLGKDKPAKLATITVAGKEKAGKFGRG